MKSVLLQCTELVLYLRIVLNSIKTNAKQATYDMYMYLNLRIPELYSYVYIIII